MLKFRTFIYLVFVAVIAGSLAGGTGGNQAEIGSHIIQTDVFDEQPAAVIACVIGDPGSSGGGCGGG